MNRQDALRLLEKSLELPPHTLGGGETLRDLEGWDSLSTMTIIALVDKEFGLPLPGSQVAQCQTVEELLALFADASAKRAA